ncbi:hypothetical protein [Streptomyces sp. NPDC054783]
MAALTSLLLWVAQSVVAAGALHSGLGAAFIPATLAVLALPAAVSLYLLRAARRPA